MRVSLNWLKELVDINLAPEELGQILTIAGFEVEEIEDLRTFADGVVVGKVIKRDRHPDADKLSVCEVDVGVDTPLNIVCGASNVRADIYVPVATVGTYLPAVDLKLKPTKLRGVPSEGMICSLSELGLEKESEGIHIFSGDIKPGDDVRPLLGLDDVILDLATTANRADALSMVGIAREVAALTDVEVRLPEAEATNLTENSSLKVTITETQACPAYIGTVIEGVKIAPSPDWLQWRLQAGGVRPINNVVDITNYVLLEWGQPLHAFDQEKLQQVAENQDITIGVRFATEGESLKTLDEQERKLVTQNLLITANDTPVALAGVMGGETTEVDENTVNVVLEAALFDPVAVRRSSRSQGLRSEASTRYERGVNQVELDHACSRAVALLRSIAGGTPAAQSMVDHRPDWDSMDAIELRLSRIHQLLGEVETEDGTGYISQAEVSTILTALGCQLTKSTEKADTWLVKVPPYRYRDLEREIDLIEEVARLYGYDRFCDTLPDKTEPGYLSVEYQILNKLRNAFRGVGLTELVHYSLVKPTGEEVTLANPLFAEYSALRTDLISGLIDAFAYNQSQGNGGLNGFEIGRVFWKTEDGVGEGDKVAGIMGGAFYPEGGWTSGGKPPALTWYEAKGILDGVFNVLGLNITYRADDSDSRLHPGRTASLWLEGKQLGIFGQLHPELVKQRDLIDEVYVFELAFDNLATALNREKVTTPKFQTYSAYPASQRDLAFFAPLDLAVTEIEKVMTKAGGKLLDKIEVFDEYQGKNVPEGQRSLAFNLVYRASDRTLQDKDVDPVHQKVRDTLVKKFDVTLRS
ncbi:Phenylalanine--tRNA ligase beta subunit [Hyella patelloides LEGE 07179]|uniref:Phenylalanine--tRNA ligase beta subunit n=1 Tax=Hyella patelloides LEGE 07179 TaxID=945734 RepID=A0A563VYR1_9CYAN|nr:phenylalanine--tRNA ligase subunit beta [Hyella patelloides]VEP16594.1 Phenylalanine--tRNA ligase beta subunit [Hyella patelloides LEGE 07179]